MRQRLSWLDSVVTFRSKADEITQCAPGIKGQSYTHVVLLGLGGMSLWPEVCCAAFGAAPG